jgi:putative protease
MKSSKKPELLMPAGTFQKLKTAILYGADAVYAGTPDLSLRTKADFTLEELKEGVKFVHEHGKKIYITLNLFTHNKDIEKLPEMIDALRDVHPDGLIIADPGVFAMVRERAPELELHISTQANVCSWLTVDYWEKQGADLCVLAREVSFAEIQEIREKCPNIKLEAFVHGAMCMAQSGRCLLSNFMAERGANQGSCAHCCRWNYKVHLRLRDGSIKELVIDDSNREMFDFLIEEEFRPGQMIQIEEDELGTYMMNAKDLCLMPKLSEYIKIGIDSFKVEGRHKTEFYVACVARAYRKAIDDYFKDPENWDAQKYLDELFAIQNRGYTMAFHEGRLSNIAHDYTSARSLSEYEYAGRIKKYDDNGDMIFEVRNEMTPGELIQFLPPAGQEPVRMRLQEFVDSMTGIATEKVSPGQGKSIRIPASIFHFTQGEDLQKILPPFTIARKKKRIIDEQTMQHIEENKLALLSEAAGKKIEPKLGLGLKVPGAMPLSSTPSAVRGLPIVESRSLKQQGPRYGSQACCGKGCNGCLVFWNDRRFEGARERLRKKAIGEKLSAEKRSD